MVDRIFLAAAVLGQVMGRQSLNDSEAEAVLGRLQKNLFVRTNRIPWKNIHLLAVLAKLIDDRRGSLSSIQTGIRRVIGSGYVGLGWL